MQTINRVFLAGIFITFAVTGANAEGLRGKAGIFGDVGYSSFAMGDVNKELIHYIGGLNNITGGFTCGGGLQYGLFEWLLIGAEAEYLHAVSEYEIQNPYGFSSTVIKVAFPLLTTGGFAKAVFQATDEFYWLLGIGMDYLSLSGELKAGSVVTDQKGTGTGVKLLVGGHFFSSENFSLGIELGYRMATITEIRDQYNRVMTLSTGENATADYSGMITRLVNGIYF